jgi:hypothetical protein
MFANGSMHDA